MKFQSEREPCAFASGPSVAATTNQLRKMRNDRNGIAVSNVTYLINRRRRMENFFLFILSSSSCTLVTSVVLLLRPITAMP